MSGLLLSSVVAAPFIAAVILLFELVAGAVSSQLLTDETVLMREWVGGGMIILAAWLAAQIHAGDET